MAPAVFKARAPGSLMIMGEHAVLHGHPAIVAAVNAWMQVELIPRDDRKLRIESELGVAESEWAGLADWSKHKDFRFVGAALSAYADKLPGGCTLIIQSEFRSTIGFGSSAAVTVACLGVLRSFCGLEVDRPSIAREARALIRAVQGRGSGADAAASALGGMVYMDPGRDVFESMAFTPPLSMVYAGYKTPTPEVIQHVENHWQARAEEVRALYQRMGECTRLAKGAIQANDLEALAEGCNQYQEYLVELGVSNPDLDGIVQTLRQAMPGAKISGAGLGDCVIGIGSSEGQCKGVETVTVPLSQQGLVI